MGQDIFKPRGKTKKSTAGAGVASVYDVPIICTVMDTVDPTHQGRIAVYPSENADKDAFKSNNWIFVNRLATFYGNTEAIGPSEEDESGGGGFGEYASNPSSYGQWNAPPDKLTKVICIFVNGDPNYGFYIGMAPNPETLAMIPAIGSSENVTLNDGEAQSYGGAPRLPTTNINTNNKNIADSTSYLTDAKPVHSYTASIMQQQGILRDKYRGPISTSATREASSRVGWGVSTPGRPVYQGGLTDEDIASKLDLEPENYRVVTRRGGHSLIMDDGDIIGRDQLIRLRTALGHQILMSDDGQMLSILHSNGQTYIELGKEGTVDVFATNSVNIRTQGDLNLHADNDLNIDAKNININSRENMTLNTDKVFSQRVGEDYNLYALKDIKMKSDAGLAIEATGQIGLKSAAEIFAEGSKIHLNDGAASLTPEKVEPIDDILHPDTLFDDQKGWAAALAKLPSIVSRAPAHMPWMNANQGADVSVDPSSAGALPAAPSENIASVNEALGGTDIGGDTPASTFSGASMPETGSISSALDKNSTSSMLAGVAGKANDAMAAGNAVASTVGGAVGDAGATLVAGKFGQTPSQLATSGILKPGADTMVNTLVASGASSAVKAIGGASGSAAKTALSKVIPTSAFSGSGGVNSATQYIDSTTTQAKGVVTGLQKGQKALQTVGAITGKEAPGGIRAVVSGTMTASSAGGKIGDNVSKVSGIIGKATDIGGIAGGASGDVLNSMKGGAASIVSSSLSGGVGGITSALDTLGSKLEIPGIGIDLNIGAAASSFKSIVNSFPEMKAGVPQDLNAIAGEAAAKVAGASAGMSSADLAIPSSIATDLAASVGAGATGAIGDLTNSATGAVGAITSGTGAVATLKDSAKGLASSAIGTAVSDVSSVASSATSLTQKGSLQNAANKVQRGATATISSTIASGVSNLPGGQKLGESVVDNAKGAVNAIADGLGPVTNALSDVGAKAFSGSDIGASIKSGASALGDISGAAGAITGALTGAAAGALSGALSPGATAALKSALASLTAGGGSTVKLPVVALNTYDRESLTSLIDSTIGPDIIPRPNLLGKISPKALSAFSALTALRKELTSDIKTVSSLSKSLAKQQKAVAEAKATLPAGSPEIARLEREYQQAATSPQYLNLVAKVKGAKETFGSKIAPFEELSSETVTQTNPFSDIEQAIQVASTNTSNQSINTEADNSNPAQDPAQTNQYGLDGLNENGINRANFNENTFSNIYSTVVKEEPVEEIVPIIVDEGEPVIENTIEAIIGEPTDGAGGVSQDVAIGIGNDFQFIDIDEYSGYGAGDNPGLRNGGGTWYWDSGDITWKLK